MIRTLVLASLVAGYVLVRRGRLSRDAERISDDLDTALADSFPASDPPSMTSPISGVATTVDQKAPLH